MANTTVATAANFIPEVWSSEVLEAYHKNTVLAPLFNRDFERLVANSGDTIHIPDFAEISAVETTDQPTGDAALSFTANNETKKDISLNRHVYAAVKIDDQALYQSLVPFMEMYSAEMGRAISAKLDAKLASDTTDGIDGFSATQAVGTVNVDVTDDNILRARQYLDDANAPHENRYLAVSPATLMSLYKIDKFVNNLYATAVGAMPGNKGRGYVGRIYDFDVYETTNLVNKAPGTANGAWQKNVIVLVVQKKPEVTKREPHDEFATAIRAQLLYGFTNVRTASGVEVLGK
jgi:hypothetical protein